MSQIRWTASLAPLLVLVAVGLAWAAPRQPTGGPDAKKTLPQVDPSVREVARANNDFALDLYARVAGDKEGKNLFFSPYSISGALALVIEGARGETALEMGKVLRYPDTLRGDASLPWDTGRLHTGMAALNSHLSGGGRPAPREVREKITALRADLASVNAWVNDLQRHGQWRESETALKNAQKLADQINQLQAEYGQYELRIANALWGEKTYPFRQAYLDTLARHYQTGGLYPVDFRNDFEAARLKINAWVEEQTSRRIKNMIPKNLLDAESQRLVRLILTNAIYFKGEWETVFPEGQTKEAAFYLADKSKARVPLMRKDGMTSARYAAFKGDGSLFATPARVAFGGEDADKVYPDERGFQMLELPYKGGTLSMVVIVPRSADGLTVIEKGLTGSRLQSWIGSLQGRAVHVQLPKFKLETKYDLGQTLQQLGMKRAFRDPRDKDGAQFYGMTDSRDPSDQLYISKVLHKAFVEVNEKGTEAAAATAVIMMRPTSAPVSRPFVPTVRADRPFLFLIRDVSTGSILFLGRMMNPTAEEG